ncbi:ATP-dependent zinc metalloprotease FtsH [Durusdinium trenchii]|uniref:ATP-dependent zinc metalloprotease FtsH n=2 Tax=Durusdinium trenchii TaxID=1381693 RepID=A0ABP0J2U6_9DINO
MAVFSKMSGRRTAVPVVLGAAALAATSFVVPGTPVQQISARTPVAAQVKQDAVSSLPGLTAGMTMGMTAAAAAANRRKPARSQRSVAKAKKELSESGLLHLVASVQDVLSKPHEGDRMRNLKALAAELKHNQQKSTSPMEGPLRWVTNMAASLLLTQGMALQPAHAGDVINYSDFIDSVNKGDVEMVRVQPDMLSAQYITKEGARREVNLIPNAQIEDQLFNQLADKKVDVVMSTGEAGSPLDFLARFAGPLAWLVAGLLLLFGGVGGPAGPGGPGGNPFELGKSKARIIKDGDTKVKFGDVAGCDGAKTELVEVVDFLKNASRYSELGAQIPKGALLVGPPGTGKTLLAKAVAGEAGVPFFSISASEFVEVFAGVGASRVRDLFEQAKKSAPCIIFIDEIDAVGRQRSAGFGQGNDEREQTVNQLLTEMDGFESNKGVVVLAATNRADILDQALVRPGRFDRQIQVDPPDVQGRLEILKVHAKGKNLAPGIDLSAIAKQTPGMSGADLANLLNEGAIVAARQNKSEIDSDDIFNALERIALGLERKDAVMSEQRRRLVAYHEAGHAILGALVNDYDAVAKISIVPRGPAGGVTIFMPSEERLNSGLYSKEFLENRMCVALGGRLAEEIVNGKDNVTTGASNDFQQCTQVAKQMVMQLGMSPVIGQRQLGGQQGGPFMGRDFMGQGAPPMSQALKQQVDDEVKRIVDEQYQRGMKLLRDNMFLLDELAKLLLEQEKVSGEELVKLINRAAIEGKLAVANKQMAFAAFTGEKVDASKSSDSKLPSKCIPSMTSMASMPKGFCGSTLRSRHDRAAARNAIARLGLAGDEKIVTSEKVLEEVERMAADVSNGSALPSQVVRTAAVQTLVSLAAMAGPSVAIADDLAVPQSIPQPMTQMATPTQATGRVTYSRFLEFVEDGAVKRVDMYDMGRTAVASVNIAGREQQLICDLPGASTGVIDKLVKKNVAIDVHQPEKPNPLFGALANAALPLLTIAGLLFLRSRNPGSGGIPGLGNQGKAQIMISPDTGVKFENVAGIDEAKEELTEIVDFLKAPERFVKVGAKIPRGVLLTGPPGTGKTLMAKALAGEAGVPFIQSSASEFIELFVGVGASRVRDIFKQAKEKAPCIVFIDEIDAIGRQRGAGMGGGNDEREQTLNQILTEMDGFEGNSGVIVVAATNRSDILDNALLRPGRFDRRVTVGLPDVKGREQILEVHIRNKKLAEGITLTEIAKRTAGFSGADLENLMNESAILAARRNKNAVTMDEINDATDRVIAGLEGRALNDNASKKLIAYHEAGHAIVGSLLPHHDPVNKVTVIPRGQAKGLTWFTPGEDQSLISAAMLKARIAGALGGRVAEQLVFGSSQVTTGAGGDLQQVERMARAMVTQFGMSEVGSIAIDDGGFGGPNYSEDLNSKIDSAIKNISDECFLTAWNLLETRRDCLDKVAEELCEMETITGDRLREIIAQYTEVPEKMAVV